MTVIAITRVATATTRRTYLHNSLASSARTATHRRWVPRVFSPEPFQHLVGGRDRRRDDRQAALLLDDRHRRQRRHLHARREDEHVDVAKLQGPCRSCTSASGSRRPTSRLSGISSAIRSTTLIVFGLDVVGDHARQRLRDTVRSSRSVSRPAHEGCRPARPRSSRRGCSRPLSRCVTSCSRFCDARW